MNFRPELALAIIDGRKWVTRRPVSDNPNSPYHPDRAERTVGKVIAICPGRGKPAVDHVRVLTVEREVFAPAHITADEARAEGFLSVSAFLGTWARLHGTLEAVDVWRYGFERRRWAIATGLVWHRSRRCAEQAGARGGWRPFHLFAPADAAFYRPCFRCASGRFGAYSTDPARS